MEPNTEQEYINAKYPSFRVSDVIFMGVLIALAIAVRQFAGVNWWLLIGVICGLIGWEFTNARLRRNAREFAEASQPAA